MKHERHDTEDDWRENKRVDPEKKGKTWVFPVLLGPRHDRLVAGFTVL
jgi:hypothetical protein